MRRRRRVSLRSRSGSGVSSWLRSPLLHFLALGALLFAAARGLAPPGAGEPPPEAKPRIEIGAATVADLRRDLTERLGRPPAPSELEASIAAQIEEEILHREALSRGWLEQDEGVRARLLQKMLFLEDDADLEDAERLLARAFELGLHRDDVVVRRILVGRMRLMATALPEDEAPSEEEVARRYALGAERYREPDRIRFVHVFLGSDRRGAAARRDAIALRDRLERESLPAARAVELGDPFPLGHHLELHSARELERTFGGEMDGRLFDLRRHVWVGPIESAYGQHLVRVEHVEPGRIPPLESVAGRIRGALEAERGEARLAALIDTLRSRYEIRVEADADGTRPLAGEARVGMRRESD